MIYEDFVIYSTGGHDTVWFKFETHSVYTLPYLFKTAQERWDKFGYPPPKALYVLRRHNPTFIAPGDSFCGFDNRTDSNALKYYKEQGLTHVSA